MRRYGGKKISFHPRYGVLVSTVERVLDLSVVSLRVRVPVSRGDFVPYVPNS